MEIKSFLVKSEIPDDQKLKKSLGGNHKLWEEIKKSLLSKYGILTEEWKYYGQKSGWVLKNYYKKRNLFFLVVNEKHFTITFVLGDKAVNSAEKSDLPKNIISELLNATKYAEGRSISIQVKNKSDVEIIKKLVSIKIMN